MTDADFNEWVADGTGATLGEFLAAREARRTHYNANREYYESMMQAQRNASNVIPAGNSDLANAWHQVGAGMTERTR